MVLEVWHDRRDQRFANLRFMIWRRNRRATPRMNSLEDCYGDKSGSFLEEFCRVSRFCRQLHDAEGGDSKVLLRWFLEDGLCWMDREVWAGSVDGVIGSWWKVSVKRFCLKLWHLVQWLLCLLLEASISPLRIDVEFVGKTLPFPVLFFFNSDLFLFLLVTMLLLRLWCCCSVHYSSISVIGELVSSCENCMKDCSHGIWLQDHSRLKMRVFGWNGKIG